MTHQSGLRRRTIEATDDWPYDFLDEDAQSCCDTYRYSRAGFDLQQVEAIGLRDAFPDPAMDPIAGLLRDLDRYALDFWKPPG